MPRGSPYHDLSFPRGGIDLSRAYAKQPTHNSPGGYVSTTAIGRNVRAYEPATDRSRGGSRAGLSKFLAAQPNGTSLIQEMNVLVGTYDPPGGGSMQQSNSGRVVTLVAVVQGQIRTLDAGDTAWNTPTNNTSNPPLNSTGVMQSSALQQKLYFADGSHKVYYDPALDSINVWAVTAGIFPADVEGNLPRLICTWRGRLVQSGVLLDQHNWFMTAVDAPGDFDYSPVSQSATQAVAGNNSSLGLIGDMVTSLLPWSDEWLIFGCDHEIWVMTGDPMDGGSLFSVTRSIGMAWGAPWATDPYGSIFFMANRPAIYTMVPGKPPERISRPIESLLQNIDTGTNTIRMSWNDRAQGLHVFVSPTVEPGAVGDVTHFFYEGRTGAWFTDTLPPDMDPLCCVTFDGNEANDRVVLIGSWDGYVRAIDHEAEDDDGEEIDSRVLLGPFLTPNLDDVMIDDLQAVLGEDSDDVTFSIYVGDTAEAALSNSPVRTGLWRGGRNLSTLIKRASHALYVEISSPNRWAIEQIRMKVRVRSGPRMKGR